MRKQNSKYAIRGKRRFRSASVLALMAIFLCSAFGCTMLPSMDKPPTSRQTANDQAPALTRADPGYMHYMDKQSMLGSAGELSSIVTGTSLSWRMPGSLGKADELLQAAGVWVRINPQTVLAPGHTSPLGQLGGPILWKTLSQAGFNGMYLAPSGGSAALWESGRVISAGDGEDVVQYKFAISTGNDDEYRGLIQMASENRSLAGADTVPAAIGIGPDFFLATRALRTYPGLFCMVEAPREVWPELPSPLTELGAMPLTGQQVAALAEKKILPLQMQQDRLDYLPPTGWAATAPVRGIDGNLRRWIFRYFERADRPILNWSDPNTTARQVVNGGIIRQVGIFANALSGYRVQPFMGLEAASSKTIPIEAESNTSLAREASANITRQIRSYGGWSWMRDELPLQLLQSFQQEGPDFIHDSVLSPAAEHALLSGQAELLRFMFDEAMSYDIDFRRLVHDSTGHEGLHYLLPHLQYLYRYGQQSPSTLTTRNGKYAKQLEQNSLTEVRDILREGAESAKTGTAAGKTSHGGLTLAGMRLFITPAGIAAAAMRLPTDARPDSGQVAEIRRGHRLLVFFKAMLPGILMLSGQDLTGVMPMTWQDMHSTPDKWDQRMASQGSLALLNNSLGEKLNKIGTPAGYSLYGPVDAQIHNASSFLSEIRDILRLRKRLGLESGTVIGRLSTTGPSPGIFCLVTKTPAGAYCVSLVNFSRQPSSFSINLSELSALQKAVEQHGIQAVYGELDATGTNQQSVTLNLSGWGCALLYAGPENL